jgi:hypothetical protein
MAYRKKIKGVTGIKDDKALKFILDTLENTGVINYLEM